MSRIKELEKLLRKASKDYYDGIPSLADQDFDKLRDDLESLDPTNSFLSEVGAPADSALTKVKHSIPMGSLNKMDGPKKDAQLATWRNSMPKGLVVVQRKLDGLSIELVYRNGKFVLAITRGDGKVGEDVTHTIKYAKHLPKTISVTDRQVSVRCEVMLYIADWEKHFTGANPRNSASGTVRRTDAKLSEWLACIAFDVEFDNNCFATEQDRIEWLENEKFTTTPSEVIDISRMEEAIKRIEDKREFMYYEIDGAVIKLNDIAAQEKLGEHNGRPYWARAYKFTPMAGYSVVKDITWSVGTQGTITPVANIEPVRVGGTVISNVSLSNMDEIERLGLWIGDEVEVIRAGDVIPKIVKVTASGKIRTCIGLIRCPICNALVNRDGPFYRCSNTESCAGVNSSKIKKYIKKRNIMYIGDSTVDTLISAGLLKDAADVYHVTNANMIAAGIGVKMVKKIRVEIDKSRTCSLADMVGSLSIDLLGRSEASNLVGHGVDTLDKWKNLTATEIAGYPGYQSTKAKRISTALKDRWKLIEKLSRCLTIADPVKITGGKLEGDSFVICLTGKMSRPKKEIAADIEAAGCQVLDSVNKSITHLCQADPNSQSTKSKKAEKLGIPVISEQQLVDMLR